MDNLLTDKNSSSKSIESNLVFGGEAFNLESETN